MGFGPSCPYLCPLTEVLKSTINLAGFLRCSETCSANDWLLLIAVKLTLLGGLPDVLAITIESAVAITTSHKRALRKSWDRPTGCPISLVVVAHLSTNSTDLLIVMSLFAPWRLFTIIFHYTVYREFKSTTTTDWFAIKRHSAFTRFITMRELLLTATKPYSW